MKHAVKCGLALMLIMAFVLSGLLIAVCAGHECTHTACACPENDCPHSRCDVCDIIAVCKKALSAAALVALIYVCAMHAGTAFLRSGSVYKWTVRTPVQMRTLLLC